MLWLALACACLCAGCGLVGNPVDDVSHTDPQETAAPPISGSCPRWADWTCVDVNGCAARCEADDVDVACSSSLCATAFRGSAGYITCDVPDDLAPTCAEACKAAVVESGCVDELH